MIDVIKKEFTLIRILILLLIAVSGIYLFNIVWQIIGSFSDLIIIFISSWLLSFILEPLVNKISKIFGLSKVLTALFVYLFLLIVLGISIFLFIPILSNQIETLSEIIPRYLATAPSFISKWGENLVPALNNAVSFVPSLAQFFFYIFIIFIISFYLVVDKEKINKEIINLTPKDWHENFKFAQNAINDVFTSFLQVQLIFGILSGVITWFVLAVFNIEFSATVGLISGIFGAIPLIGPVLALAPPLFITAILDPQRIIVVLIILFAVQQIIFNIVGPRLLGKAFNLHPIIVLVSFLIGYKIAGGTGAVFAIPVLGIAVLIIRKFSYFFIKPPK